MRPIGSRCELWLFAFLCKFSIYTSSPNIHRLCVSNQYIYIYFFFLSGCFKLKETNFDGFITKIYISRFVNPIFMFFMSKNLHSVALEYTIVVLITSQFLIKIEENFICGLPFFVQWIDVRFKFIFTIVLSV